MNIWKALRNWVWRQPVLHRHSFETFCDGLKRRCTTCQQRIGYSRADIRTLVSRNTNGARSTGPGALPTPTQQEA